MVDRTESMRIRLERVSGLLMLRDTSVEDIQSVDGA